MATKCKTVKKMTPEERLETERKHCLESASSEYGLTHLTEPTYFFKVGDRVLYGAMIKSEVEEILNDGKVYLLKCIARDNNYGHPFDYETYRIVAWHQIRPIINISKEYEFATNRDICLRFNNTTIESLLHKFYNFGVDMNPDYQREFVWDDTDREMLIDSIFKNIDIGKFVFIRLDGEEWTKRDVGYEILDGKQRLSTIIAFYENRFSYKGKYYNDLSGLDKNAFLQHNIVEANVANASKKEVYNYFLMLNRTGKTVDERQLKKVEQMLSES